MNHLIKTQGDFFYKPLQNLFLIVLCFAILVMTTMSTIIVLLLSIAHEENVNWYEIIHCFSDCILWGTTLHVGSSYIANKRQPKCSPITFAEYQDTLKIVASQNEIFISWDCLTQVTYNSSSHLLRLRFFDMCGQKKEITTNSYIPDEMAIKSLIKMIQANTNICVAEI